jgi:hypothetical protein
MAQNDNIYLDQNTGQYYTQQVYTPRMNNFWGGGYQNGIIGGYNPYSYNNRYSSPRITRQNTGDVSQVWKAMQNKQPYQYNVPSLASMFPSMTMPAMNNAQPSQYTGGAGQFFGGLLGNDGAARFLGTPATGATA